ncbi:MAG: hypothetical protein M9962_13945 [Oligoflexia bacterium]|nr:hypothetical protein [Oligoflexia bacterium]
MRQYNNFSENFIKKFILLSTTGIFLFFCLYSLNFPAPHFDEIFFYSASTQSNPLCCIDQKLWGIPIRLLPHLGALKAWIYAPLLSITQNLWMIRLPMIFLALFSTLILQACYLLPRKKYLSAMLIGYSSFPILFSKLDVGELSLFYFFTVCLWLFINNEKFFHYSLFIAVLGIFHRINFLSYCVPIYLFGFVFLCKKRKEIVLHFSLIVFFSLILIFYSDISFSSKPMGFSYYSFRFREILSTFNGVLDGSGIINYLFFGFPKHYFENSFITLFSLFLIVLFCFLKKFSHRKEHLFLLGGFFLSTFFTFFIFAANKYWHFLSTWFFFMLCLGFCLDHFYQAEQKILKYLSLLVFCIFIGLNFGSLFIYIKHKQEIVVRSEFTNAIYALADYCDHRSNCVIVAPFAFNQVQWAAKEKKKISYLSITMHTKVEEVETEIQSLDKQLKSDFIIYHPAALEAYPSESNHFLDLIESSKYSVYTQQNIYDSYGMPIFIALRLR